MYDEFYSSDDLAIYVKIITKIKLVIRVDFHLRKKTRSSNLFMNYVCVYI